MAEKVKIIGYCRTSTENQKEEKTIEIQEQELRDFAGKNGFELVKIFKDAGISGDLEFRDGLSELFDCLDGNNDISGVLIYKLDRLARDLIIQENIIRDIEKRGKRLFSTKETDLDSKDATRVLIRQVLGSIAQYEKAIITMRLRSGRLYKARKGGFAGGSTALGYKVQGKGLTLDTEQLCTVKRIFHLKRYKRMKLAAIARLLNVENVKTARGGNWYASTVKYILKNPIYKGKLLYSGIKAFNAKLAVVQ